MRAPHWMLAISLAHAATGAHAANADDVDLSAFLKRDEFASVKISPTGEFLAASVPEEDRTGMVIVRRADGKQTAAFSVRRRSYVDDFVWVGPNRVMLSVAVSYGALDKPVPTGELVSVNSDGTRSNALTGIAIFDDYNAFTASALVAGRPKPWQPRYLWDVLVDELPGDDKHVMVTTARLGRDVLTYAVRVNVGNGRGGVVVARAPLPRARFTTDNDGVVRFARGAGRDNVSRLYHRADDDSEWQLVNDESQTLRVESPIGFSPDNKVAYLQSQQPSGPDTIVAFDIATGSRSPLIADEVADPWRILYQTGAGNAPVGVLFLDGKPRTQFFDEASDEARLYRTLEQVFPGSAVVVTSTTRDGRYSVVETFTGDNPGDFYLFDRTERRVEHILSRRDWLDPAKMAKAEPVSLKARDGLQLRGYLTRSKTAPAGKLPMVVLPHGGPFGDFDAWGFDDEAQMLAQAGYAVLQINFRGSGNYGRAFMRSGAREWGGKMQDDVTDATRWAIAQGIADPGRICIYGAGYGAYAAMVGPAREPGLYQCAVGYAGLYDLQMMHRDDSESSESTRTWLDDWVGPIDSLAGRSATDMAGRVKVPVFLAAGGEDTIAPQGHTKNMELALKSAGVPVESLYYRTEGHGFHDDSHRLEYYTKLLDFLSRHIGGAKAAPVKATP